MEKLCRACGAELVSVQSCKYCGETICWRCENCLRLKDSVHSHSEVMKPLIAK